MSTRMEGGGMMERRAALKNVSIRIGASSDRESCRRIC